MIELFFVLWFYTPLLDKWQVYDHFDGSPVLHTKQQCYENRNVIFDAYITTARNYPEEDPDLPTVLTCLPEGVEPQK
jgi:hypothetical protein|tara:strand:- start:620 stop:850 length:231 start_codon:yes stop_codon:yes gene_type:complete